MNIEKQIDQLNQGDLIELEIKGLWRRKSEKFQVIFTGIYNDSRYGKLLAWQEPKEIYENKSKWYKFKYTNEGAQSYDTILSIEVIKKAVPIKFYCKNPECFHEMLVKKGIL